MAGIYLHIPFCKQACNYCDFHFSTSLKSKERLVKAMIREISEQAAYIEGEKIQTIYFGGGTPSLLNQKELEALLNAIYKDYSIVDTPEISLEANPDDLDALKVKELGDSPINRLSIGVQSFFDRDLKFMNRAHSASEAERAICGAQDVGIENISIDLIYGTPGLTHQDWKTNLRKAFLLDVPHLSSYALTVEKKTALEYAIRNGKTPAPDETHAAEQFDILLAETRANQYQQYELSNFCKDNKYSQHNTSYWTSENYLGIGPSAHSFNGASRRWNVSSNGQYMKAIETGSRSFETEMLGADERYNEYIMTGLRTIWGCRLDKIRSFGEKYYSHILKESAPYIKEGKLVLESEVLKATDTGKFFLDKISSDLFYS